MSYYSPEPAEIMDVDDLESEVGNASEVEHTVDDELPTPRQKKPSEIKAWQEHILPLIQDENARVPANIDDLLQQTLDARNGRDIGKTKMAKFNSLKIREFEKLHADLANTTAEKDSCLDDFENLQREYARLEAKASRMHSTHNTNDALEKIIMKKNDELQKKNDEMQQHILQLQQQIIDLTQTPDAQVARPLVEEPNPPTSTMNAIDPTLIFGQEVAEPTQRVIHYIPARSTSIHDHLLNEHEEQLINRMVYMIRSRSIDNLGGHMQQWLIDAEMRGIRRST